MPIPSRPVLLAALATVASSVLLLAPVAGAPPEDTPTLTGLEGTWRVDLRPTPDADPYYQELVVSVSGESAVTGTFYGAPFRDFHANLDWGVLHFAFVTEDGSGEYHTTGHLVNGRLEGTTHSLGREFLSVWTAERADADGD